MWAGTGLMGTGTRVWPSGYSDLANDATTVALGDYRLPASSNPLVVGAAPERSAARSSDYFLYQFDTIALGAIAADDGRPFVNFTCPVAELPSRTPQHRNEFHGAGVGVRSGGSEPYRQR